MIRSHQARHKRRVIKLATLHECMRNRQNGGPLEKHQRAGELDQRVQARCWVAKPGQRGQCGLDVGPGRAADQLLPTDAPVALLAEQRYRQGHNGLHHRVVGASPQPGTVRRLNPSGYPESQGAFAERVRRETAARLGLPCQLEFGTQTEFPEPPVRINTDLLDAERLEWSEAQAWDELVTYYAS